MGYSLADAFSYPLRLVLCTHGTHSTFGFGTHSTCGTYGTYGTWVDSHSTCSARSTRFGGLADGPVAYYPVVWGAMAPVPHLALVAR